MSAVSGTDVPSSTTTAAGPKPRSCVVCRSRKVRCDKQTPCSNCRKANITCVSSASERTPRWARRYQAERLANGGQATNAPVAQEAKSDVDKVIDRLRTLENLVKELSGQLQEAQAAASSAGGSPHVVDAPQSSNQELGKENHREMSPTVSTGSMQRQFGRLVIQGASQSRYVSSGFWSRVNDELEGLKMETQTLASEEPDSSEDDFSSAKTPSTQELGRTPSQHNAFLFRHNLKAPVADLREFQPLPSQVPFLLDVFAENVNFVVQIVHMPTVTKMVREMRTGGTTHLTPSNEALLFSIYYAAITSMEDDDVMTNFGSSKTYLSLKFRLGLEHALAKADFLNAPDLTLVQAFALFLGLVRRHDSPRFVWMMTGLVIRMAHYLGLQRDGSHFEHLSPYEIEIRRRVWWMVYMLDIRASEDQGTDLTITAGTFDTKIPLNINDTDIDPETKETPKERDSVTDMTMALIFFGTAEIMTRMMATSNRHGVAGLEDQGRLLNEMCRTFDEGYLTYATESKADIYWAGVIISKLVLAKMRLIVYLPILFSSPSEDFSDDIRTKLLIAAIEVAEYNHTLNSTQKFRKWRWVYQTYTHWHAIVYLMIEISRRPWSPMIERAWLVLGSSWLIPPQTNLDKNLGIWVPLKKLMDKARKHRNSELARLRADPPATARLELEDQNLPLPSSSPMETDIEDLCERWRQLVVAPVAAPDAAGDASRGSSFAGAVPASTGLSTYVAAYTSQPATDMSSYDAVKFHSNRPMYSGAGGQQAGRLLDVGTTLDLGFDEGSSIRDYLTAGRSGNAPNNISSNVSSDWSDGRRMGLGPVSWLWADTNPSIDVFSDLDVGNLEMNMDIDDVGDGDVNWYNWVESARDMEWHAGGGGSGRI